MERETSTWWLTRWIKSETFWQGVAIQTLGTLVAAVILALVAIFVGVGYTPAVRYFVIYGLVILFSILLEITVTVYIVRLLGKALSKSKVFKRRPFLVGLLATALTIVAVFITWNGAIFLIAVIQPLLARWAGYSG